MTEKPVQHVGMFSCYSTNMSLTPQAHSLMVPERRECQRRRGSSGEPAAEAVNTYWFPTGSETKVILSGKVWSVVSCILQCPSDVNGSPETGW